MGTEITVNFIWVESGYEWEVPEGWESHGIKPSISESLNSLADDWDDTNLTTLESVVKKFISLPDFLVNPDIDLIPFSQIFKESSSATETIEVVDEKWVKLARSLLSKEINPFAIAVPQGMAPWDWYSLNETEKLNQMGFYFDVYKFGFFSYELTKDLTLDSILADSRFISYSQEIVKRGPDSQFHTACDVKCAFRTCSKMVLFPASISRW